MVHCATGSRMPLPTPVAAPQAGRQGRRGRGGGAQLCGRSVHCWRAVGAGGPGGPLERQRQVGGSSLRRCCPGIRYCHVESMGRRHVRGWAGTLCAPLAL